MTVEATHPLEKQVNGAEVADQEVKIDVQGLLGDLARHHDVPTGWPVLRLPRRSEEPEQGAVLLRPVEIDEGRVGDGHFVGA